ncbi:MAG: IS1634 family transposase [Patescibacteria group bacterium]
MAYIRKVRTASGATAVQIVHKIHGRIVKLEHIGSAHTDIDLQTLIALAKQRLLGQQQSLFPKAPAPLQVYLRQSVSQVLFTCFSELYRQLGFDKLQDTAFESLCIARIVEPTSKLDTLRVLVELGITGFSNTSIHRCLRQIITKNYRKKIAGFCFARAKSQGITLVLYDVTTLYFEAQQEDDYRKPGMSKERRLEPQIVVGLLVDQHGFPLEIHSFEGNTAETTTILPVIEQFKAEYNLKDVTVVADAGMLSAKNLQALAEAGCRYIVGSRLTKIPYDIAEYQKTKELTNGQIVTTKLGNEQRVIYQYRAKRAALDLRNIAKQIEKAKKIINGTTVTKKAKFLTLKTKEKKLNQALIDKARALAGIKGYVTNLSQPDEQIITCYHQLWRVEQSFRMSKSDLKARPIFHHKRDAIEAHLTVVFASLAISKVVEERTNLSIKKFVKLLRPIRSGTVIINGVVYPAEPEIPENVTIILKQLRVGH